MEENMNIKSNILETMGNTPIVKINQLGKNNAELLVKVESFNPGGSIKDRVGLHMIEAAEKAGKLTPGALIVEPTSGNTGVGLALAAAVKGYKLILTMPDTMSMERRALLGAYGAELRLTPGAKGMQGAIEEAEKILQENPGSFMPQQFKNPSNPETHEESTAKEILQDLDGKLDILVATVGTGGTLTGCARYLKEHIPGLQVVAVEPAESPLLSGGKAGPHKIQGIGANFIPEVLDTALIDKVACVSAEDAFETTRLLAAKEGILCGISSGAALYAGLKEEENAENKGKRILVILPDTGERYLSSGVFL